ncbi:MAG TPA: pyridoxamine 5'-phosphate oxidase family protein [Candidatus Fimimorpha faecalis]|uniref:Pyridoxamine 5'-phosphate oxidase family protein n=1 Tax=Candidatus Fimimorpha faecalis TaxID=2840824 RepID=A0A9D1EFE4_9FIRM|nr:pyridoxamine 5'-phosphate oxidase family protein [Candidatus Fimimorpha faecalis]
MFREMRRKKQQLSTKECVEILRKRTSGVLAVFGEDGYPYAVPISYVYEDGKIYFHSAKAGHKIDAIQQNSKVSFCIIDQDQVVPEKYTSYFRSVIVFGKVRILEDDQEKYKSIEQLAVKYAPDDREEERKKAIEQEWNAFCMLELTIEHMTGKEAKELAKKNC